MEQIMMSVYGLFGVAYHICFIGASVFVLWLLWRFVRAHEKMADAVIMMAQNPNDSDTL